MLNPFFLQGSKSEQGLIQDLINEQLRMYGVEICYVPRKYITKKTVIKELIESEFTSAYPLEAYVNTYDGYGGAGTLLSKFGVQPINELSLVISRERFESYITPLINSQPNIELSLRPKEGDLIYFPLGDRLFEIKFVEHENPFYQLQKTYVYELTCELFIYEDEIIDTGIEELDNNIVEYGQVQTISLVGVGSTAVATSHIVNGGLRTITVTNRGEGYESVPVVAISSAPSGGINATGIATMIGNIVNCNGSKSLRVQGVDIINAGAGYTVAPNVVFVGGGGVGAAATTTIGNGIVGSITLISGGSGYFTAPTVTVSGPTGVGDTTKAIATIDSSGKVTSIRIRDSGYGYTSNPTVSFSSPDMIGIGTYLFNEEVVGSVSGTKAIVRSWDSTTAKLKISNVTGTFKLGELLVGSTSNASYKVSNSPIDEFSDPYAQNEEIETESDAIFDFTESNPFGNA